MRAVAIIALATYFFLSYDNFQERVAVVEKQIDIISIHSRGGPKRLGAHGQVHTLPKPVTHTHTRLTALCPGLPRWILLKQETVSGSGISWAICKFAPHSRQITTPAPHHSVFTGRMRFLPPNQQRESTEGTKPVSIAQC